MLLVTSIPPRFSRRDTSGKEIGQEYLAACVRSWRDNGFEPLSINRPDEADTVKALGLLDVLPATMKEASWTNRYGPPLGDVFDILPRNELVALTNADIFMLKCDLAPLLRRDHADCMVLARRSDVSHLGAPECETFELGFDFFSFNPAHIAAVTGNASVRRFQLGAPWWDYVFPLACKKSVVAKSLREPVLVHQLHPDRWDQSVWNHLAIEAGRTLEEFSPDEFGPIMQNMGSFEDLERAITLTIRASLYSGNQQMNVSPQPCRHFARIPEQKAKSFNAELPNDSLLPVAVAAKARLARLKTGKKRSISRKVVHGARDVLRGVRNSLGLR